MRRVINGSTNMSVWGNLIKIIHENRDSYPLSSLILCYSLHFFIHLLNVLSPLLLPLLSKKKNHGDILQFITLHIPDGNIGIQTANSLTGFNTSGAHGGDYFFTAATDAFATPRFWPSLILPSAAHLLHPSLWLPFIFFIWHVQSFLLEPQLICEKRSSQIPLWRLQVVLFCQTNTSKPKDSLFMVINDKDEMKKLNVLEARTRKYL